MHYSMSVRISVNKLSDSVQVKVQMNRSACMQ